MDRFSNPCGLYADAQGNLLVADTGNARLVRLDAEGNLLAVYGAPVSQMLPSNFEYKPFKVISDTAGRIFVASRGFNRGLLELDRQGQFVQMLGASEATYSLADRIWRMFSTKAQIDRMAAFVPSEYNNISIDQEDFLLRHHRLRNHNAHPADQRPGQRCPAPGRGESRRGCQNQYHRFGQGPVGAGGRGESGQRIIRRSGPETGAGVCL